MKREKEGLLCGVVERFKLDNNLKQVAPSLTQVQQLVVALVAIGDDGHHNWAP